MHKWHHKVPDGVYPSMCVSSPGIKLESGEQGLVSLLFPEHWFPVGKRTSQWRTRSWAPLESQWDHSDQLDQLSRKQQWQRVSQPAECESAPHWITLCILVMHERPSRGWEKWKKNNRRSAACVRALSSFSLRGGNVCVYLDKPVCCKVLPRCAVPGRCLLRRLVEGCCRSSSSCSVLLHKSQST